MAHATTRIGLSTAHSLDNMGKIKRILLASHGTEGAGAAEQAAFALCRPSTVLHHLIIIPEFWEGMISSDWLSNASTRERFADYVECQLGQEIRVHVEKMKQETARRKIHYCFEVMRGRPTDCLVAAARQNQVGLIILGSPRPKGMPGYRSRIDTGVLTRSVQTPLLIVPYPQ